MKRERGRVLFFLCPTEGAASYLEKTSASGKRPSKPNADAGRRYEHGRSAYYANPLRSNIDNGLHPWIVAKTSNMENSPVKTTLLEACSWHKLFLPFIAK